jgi:ribonucleoside-diphosphate reductase beta chain
MRELIKTLAVYSAFTEGLQLVQQLRDPAELRSLPENARHVQGVEWSIRDETLHCEAMCHLTRVLIEENHWVWTDDFKAESIDCRAMVDLEDGFIDLCFREAGEIEGLTPEQVKRYIRFIADRRLNMLGLKANYGSEGENLDWIDWMLGEGHTNFFEARETEYAKGHSLDWTNAY